MKRFIILTTILLWITLGGFALYLVNRPVSSVSAEKAAFALSSNSLYKQFEENEESANAKYLGKVVELTGTVKSVETDENGDLTLMLPGDEMFGVSCKLNNNENKSAKKIQNGDEVKIKGVCSGKLMDVVLVNCSISRS